MKKKLLIYILLFCCSYVNGKSNADNAITINLHLKSGEGLRLTYFDDYLVNNNLIFKNTSNRDTTITRMIFSNNVIELRYSLRDKENIDYFNVFYLKKGDLINLELEGYRLRNQSGHDFLFVSDYLDINDSVLKIGGTPNLFEEGITMNNLVLKKNLQVIDSLTLNKKITDSVAIIWKESAYNFYYLRQSRLNNKARMKEFEAFINDLRIVIQEKKKINSTFLNAAIYSITYFNRLKSRSEFNLKTFIEDLIKIKTEKRYKTGLAFQALYNYPEKNSNLYLESYTLFNNQLNDSIFMSQSYARQISPDTKSLDRTIIKLTTPQKDNLVLEDIFKLNKGKIIVFDFWASWCVPCINELPYLEKIKSNLSKKNIVFIGISLDKDNKDMEWKNILTKFKVGYKNQFRVLEKSNSLISRLYKIESIPKYLVFDKKGMLINDSFLKPSDEEFKQKLLMLSLSN